MRRFAAKRALFQLRGNRYVDSYFAFFEQRSLRSLSPIAFIGPRGAQLETRFVAFEDVLRAIGGNVALGFRLLRWIHSTVIFIPPLQPGKPLRVVQALAEDFAAANHQVSVEPVRRTLSAFDGREVPHAVEIPHIADGIELTENIFVDEAREAFDRSFDRFRSEGFSEGEGDEVGPGVIREQSDSRIDVFFPLIQPTLFFLSQFDRNLRLFFLQRLAPLTPAPATISSTPTPIPPRQNFSRIARL